jgi:twitching motility protein PilJ
MLAAAFVSIFAAACTFNLDPSGALDPDKAAMYVHVRLADAVLAAEGAARGEAESFDELADAHRDLQAALLALRQRGQSPLAGRLASNLDPGVHEIEGVLRDREKVLEAIETGRSAIVRMPQMSAQMDEVVRGLSRAGASGVQLNIANRQIVLLDRMARRIVEVSVSGDISAADALRRDVVVFGTVLEGMATGAPEQGIERVDDPAARAAIEKVIALNQDQARDVNRLLAGADTVFKAHQAVEALGTYRQQLLGLAPPTL